MRPDQQFERKGEAVWNTQELLCVDGVQIVDLVNACKTSARKRFRLCAHREASDRVHEMLIVLGHDTYIRPHRHLGKSESFHVIEGELDVLLFDDEGELVDIVQMGTYNSGKVFFYRLANHVYHTVRVNTAYAIIHEVTPGPFVAAETEYSPWSPAEQEDEQVAEYCRGLRNLGDMGAS